jgi:hypothetical protein
MMLRPNPYDVNRQGITAAAAVVIHRPFSLILLKEKITWVEALIAHWTFILSFIDTIFLNAA